MIVKKEIIPDHSILKIEEHLYNYIDSYQGWFIKNEDSISLTEFVRLFLSSGPKWADWLMNKIVLLFGVKTAEELAEKNNRLNNLQLEIGKQFGTFELLEKSDNEVILGGVDKHLNLKVALFLEPLTDDKQNRELTITTCVKFNSLFGKMYFIPVKPFHNIIIKKTLKDIIKKLENGVDNKRLRVKPSTQSSRLPLGRFA